MKYEIKKKNPLLQYNQLILKFEKKQKDFCNGEIKSSEFTMGMIIDELNQIEHSENDHDIALLKNM
jgi:hypothetical protein